MYEKLNHLAKSLVSKITKQDDTLDLEEASTINRLQKLKERRGKLCAENEEELAADGYFAGRVGYTQPPDEEALKGVGHWTSDTGRHQKQAIRQGMQLSGSGQCFEIDPLSKLPD